MKRASAIFLAVALTTLAFSGKAQAQEIECIWDWEIQEWICYEVFEEWYEEPYYEEFFEEPMLPIIDEDLDLIGRDLNGETLAGDTLNGHYLASVGMEKQIKIGSANVKALWLIQSRFYGKDSDGNAYSGGSFVGAEFRGTMDNGKKVDLRIDAIRQDPATTNKDVYLYKVSYETKAGYKPLCGTGTNGQAIEAVPVRGTWDLSQGTATGGSWTDSFSEFTFACVNASAGKCAVNGYAPWRLIKVTTCDGAGQNCSTTAKPMRDHHLACVRMMRADYCGDGTSHTVNGSSINVYDGHGVRTDSAAWTLGAQWGVNGAVCASSFRVPSLATNLSCAAQLQSATCGATSNFSATTLLISEHQ